MKQINKLVLTSSERGTRLSQKSHDTTSLVSDIWSNSSTLNRNGGSSTMNQRHSNDSAINMRERERERERGGGQGRRKKERGK